MPFVDRARIGGHPSATGASAIHSTGAGSAEATLAGYDPTRVRSDLRLVDTHGSDFRTPLPFGVKARAVGYRFQRPTTTASVTRRSS